MKHTGTTKTNKRHLCFQNLPPAAGNRSQSITTQQAGEALKKHVKETCRGGGEAEGASNPEMEPGLGDVSESLPELMVSAGWGSIYQRKGEGSGACSSYGGQHVAAGAGRGWPGGSDGNQIGQGSRREAIHGFVGHAEESGFYLL